MNVTFNCYSNNINNRGCVYMTLFKNETKKALSSSQRVVAGFTFAMGIDAGHSASATAKRVTFTMVPTTTGVSLVVEDGRYLPASRFYMGTYLLVRGDGVRQNAGWREAWGYKY